MKSNIKILPETVMPPQIRRFLLMNQLQHDYDYFRWFRYVNRGGGDRAAAESEFL